MALLKCFAGTGKPQYLEPANEKVPKKGSLPLTWDEELLEAVKNQKLDEVKKLVTSVSWEPSGPYVPVAAQWGHADIVEVLSTAKANMDAMLWGKPAVMFAAENGHLMCCEIIIKNGGSKDALDLDGETALSRAELNGHKHVVDFLRSVGAKEFSLRGMLKKRDVAAVSGWVASALHEEGGSIEERDRRVALVDEVSRCSGEEVMLLLAAQAGDLAEVKRLVEEEAVDPETKSADGKTCLELAAREAHIPVVQYLSLFADHGQVKAILANLRPAGAGAGPGQAKSKAAGGKSVKKKKGTSNNSVSSKDSESNDGG
eukprot:gnl/MRDRNA2_/MRDRNA2_90460_c0_seq1.p1 gnl/MRDRNA2_/MRDRNA2_90460_c0~~gnl/MRDRNA2_/MRDRNA2_90460_c0_seq1.p1  ORF type:complete len:315 (+),score=98.49 gnl/MRDRNA2_/MRDRNA2_90460_c0_seq1:94-1038(+)